jgi:hypothetical protein
LSAETCFNEIFSEHIDAFAAKVSSQNTSSRARVFTGDSNQGGVSEINDDDDDDDNSIQF